MTMPLADELLIQLSAPDRRAATDLCVALVESGMPLRDLVDEGLAPAMRQVGALWESAVWTVVDEHIATAVAETALSAAAAHHGRFDTRGEVVVACVEGDWHSLPSRMVAEVLDNEGWSVRFLGASHPTSSLSDYVQRHRPQAVLLTCSIPMALPALLHAIHSLHQLQTVVYVGGRALGDTPRRAAALGADGWAATAAEAAELAARPPAATPAAPALAHLTSYHALQLLLPAWTEQAIDVLTTLMPAVAHFPPDIRERTRLDLHHLLDTAGIAALLEDDRLLLEQGHWLAAIFTARGVPANAVAHGLTSLLATEPPHAVAANIRALLTTAHHALTPASPAS